MTAYNKSNRLTKPSKCVSAKCHRCGGSGIVPPWGECFRCGGNGKDPSDRAWAFPAGWSDEQCKAHLDALDAKNAAARERARAKREAISGALFAENCAAHPALAEAAAINREYLDGYPHGPLDERGDPIPQGEAFDAKVREYEKGDLPSFVRDILWKARKFPISEKQAAAVARALDVHKARASKQDDRKPVPAGRVSLSGVVVSLKDSASRYGVVRKMLVKGDGWKVYGTVPAGLGQVAVGASVEFTADVKPSDDDAAFGFFSHPRANN